ncbi:MAG: hypothetical protein WCI46_13810 [Verrucomicrobiota bacterium]
MSDPIGATCAIVFTGDDDDDVWAIYISFSPAPSEEESDNEGAVDAYGILDNEIYFYCKDEAELKELTNKDDKEDFWVKDYTLEYLD